MLSANPEMIPLVCETLKRAQHFAEEAAPNSISRLVDAIKGLPMGELMLTAAGTGASMAVWRYRRSRDAGFEVLREEL